MVKKMDEMEVDIDVIELVVCILDRCTVINRSLRVIKGNGVFSVSPMRAHSEAVAFDSDNLPMTFQYALQLTFEMFAYTLRNPTRKLSPFVRPSLNPYNAILLTFLSTVMKHDAVRQVFEKSVPW